MEHGGSMRIIFFTDGSDDGLLAAKTVASLIDPSVVNTVTLVAVTWPERESPLWDRAHGLRLVAYDDLHYAVELAADQALKQLRSHLALHAGSIDEIVMVGEPAGRLLTLVTDQQPDLVFIAVTSGRRRTAVATWVVEVTKNASCPIVVIHAVAPEQRPGVDEETRFKARAQAADRGLNAYDLTVAASFPASDPPQSWNR